MRADKRDRYQNAPELLDDLETFQDLLSEDLDASRFRFAVSRRLNFARLMGPIIAGLLVFMLGLMYLIQEKADQRQPRATFQQSE